MSLLDVPDFSIGRLQLRGVNIPSSMLAGWYFFDRISLPGKSRYHVVEDRFHLFLEEGNKNIILVIEVKINGSVGNASLSRDIGYLRLKKTFPGKYPCRRLYDPFMFIVSSLFHSREELPLFHSLIRRTDKHE